MGKGGAPCCEKVGLNRGPWTPAEDMKLKAHIQKFGHDNWRALPKHAGLLRCGKSCRLRWINYLRPDIKRGNYTQEEEETIIKLHGLLGNKWSKIASQLPGRTDNEIKNVWHTHLKKKISKKLEPPPPPPIQDQKESTINIQTSSPDSMLANDHHVYCKEINPVEKQTDPIEKVDSMLSNDHRVYCKEINPVEKQTDPIEKVDSMLSNDHRVYCKEINPVEKQTDPIEKVEPSKDPIEIPMYPNMDIWNMQLDDGSPSLGMSQFAEVDGICNANLNTKLATKLQPNYSAHDKPQPTMSYSPTSSACSTNNSSRLCLSQLSDGDSMFAEKPQAGKCDVRINLPNEYSMDMWGVLDQDDARELLSISVGSERKLEAQNTAKEERESEEDTEDHKSWLMDLEYELELCANKDEQQTLVAAAGLDEPLDYSPANFDGTLEYDVDPIVAYFQTHPSSPICF